MPAELIFGSKIRNLKEKLLQTEDITTVRNLIEKFLLDDSKKSEHHNIRRINESVRLLLNYKGNIDLSFVCDKVCMSERNFRRVFTELTGYRPKELARVIRTKNLIHYLKRGGSFGNAIYRLGYFDYSHFVRDFKKIGGFSPSRFLKQMDEIDDKFIRVSEYSPSFEHHSTTFY